MRIVIFLSTLLLLSACGFQQEKVMVTKTNQVVIIPDFSKYPCPPVPTLPETKNLTDIVVAKLIAKLYQNNRSCYEGMEAMKFFLENSKKRIETPTN